MLLNALRKLDLPKSTDLSPAAGYHLTTLLLLISLPMMFAFPTWVAGLVLLSVGLKWYSIRRRFHVSRGVTFAIFSLAAVLIAGNFTLLGREFAGVVFLLVMASLKLLEAKAQRDAFLLMLIYFLLIMSGLMTSQSPLVFFYLFACLLYNIFTQMRVTQPQNIRLSWQNVTKSIAKMVVVALPFVLVLFFFFPRIEPLWKQPHLPRSQTGLSDEMSPSGLSELAQNGGLAFRAVFDGTPPPNRDLYWRGPVLVDFDGRTWRQHKAPADPDTTLNVVQDSRVDYRVYHNGSTRKWVLPLDMPVGTPSQTQQNFGYTLKAQDDISKPTAFSLTSYTQYQLTGLSDAQRQRYTTLPENRFPKAKQLAQQLYNNSQNNVDFIQQLLRYFNENPYYYDLSSPRGNDDIDTFLFENQAGYCEHYSSAFAFMLRSVGIPTRVVIGYQGGEINRVSNEMEVKQLNAHAWVEAYLPPKGWTRFDPTAAVAPNRVISGSPLGVAENANLIDFTARLEGNFAGYRYFSESLRALSSFWQNWIINYNQNKQNDLWRRLGLHAMPPLAWILSLFALLPIVVLAVLWYRRYRLRKSGDAVWRAMQPFIQFLDRQGIVCPTNQPLLSFIQSTATQQALGKNHRYAENVVSIYYQLRYGNSTHVDTLNNAIANFVRQYDRR